jgi:hypothetical protein
MSGVRILDLRRGRARMEGSDIHYKERNIRSHTYKFLNIL